MLRSVGYRAEPLSSSSQEGDSGCAVPFDAKRGGGNATRVPGLGFRVQELGFKIQGLGFKV